MSSPVCRLKQNNHLLTRMKSNAVATAYQQRGPSAGRPGLWQQDQAQLPVASLQRLPTSPKPGLRREQGDHPVSGRDLLGVHRPAGALRRRDPSTRGACLLMCTNTLPLTPSRSFASMGCASRSGTPSSRQCARSVPSPAFLDVQHEAAAPQQRQSASASRHAETGARRRRAASTYHVFIQAGIICQGLLQVPACLPIASLVELCFRLLAADHFRPGIPPSELVVAITLRHTLPEFLLNTPQSSIFTKFVTERQDTNKMQAFRLAA